MFVAKYRNFRFDFRGNNSMKKIDNLKNILKNAQKIAVIGTVLVMMFTGCSNPERAKEQAELEKYGTPCDKVLGNGEFVIHNFVGEKSGNMQHATMAEDVNYYLGKAETYMQDKIDDFEKSLKGDTYAQNYFQNFIAAQRSNEFERLTSVQNNLNAYGIDETINGIAKPCFPIFEEFMDNIDNNRDLCIFTTGCKTIFAVNYNFALGAYRNKETPLDQKYQTMRKAIRREWNSKTINHDLDIDNDIENANCIGITNELSRIINTTAPKMGLKPKQIREAMFGFGAATVELLAMDDRAASDLKHNVCNADMLLMHKIDIYADELFEQQQAQKSCQVQTYDNTMGK